MYTSDVQGDLLIQFHRFKEDSPLHPLIKTVSHIAIQVESLQETIQGYEILLRFYETIFGYKVAIINENNVPIKLSETRILPSELWGKAQAQDQEDLSTDNLEGYSLDNSKECIQSFTNLKPISNTKTVLLL